MKVANLAVQFSWSICVGYRTGMGISVKVANLAVQFSWSICVGYRTGMGISVKIANLAVQFSWSICVGYRTGMGIRMEKIKLGFSEFIAAVDDGNKAFVMDLHQEFIAHGCKMEVKEAKSGYVVSYLLNKRTVANYVFRKAGVMIRVYANHVKDYMEFLETLPIGMVKNIEDAMICKRLANPDDCNPKCAMGYDFLLHGRRFQKCRNSAFMFLLCEENNVFLKAFVENELNACI